VGWCRSAGVLLLALVCSVAHAAELDTLHFLIPAGPGGGWDGTARGVGEALTKAGIVEHASFENLSGGGGGRAIAKLIETAERQQKTMLVGSTPFVVRSLQKVFPQSFRDLRPVASVIADYAVFAVRTESAWQSWADVMNAYDKNPRSVKIAGGSVRGSTDHLVIVSALQASGRDPRRALYIPYDGGGRAMAGLLTGETDLLSTGFGEAVDMTRSDTVRILAVAAPTRLPEGPDIPTLNEQGVPFEFANWRGFFAAPGLPEARYAQMEAALRAMLGTKEFEAVRNRMGWTVLHTEGDAFFSFLENQEAEIGEMMGKLGFRRR
tara:strand:+ start:1155 stop:2120 length:966 start_codon:yes stop_codon:yes gene_type:complete